MAEFPNSPFVKKTVSEQGRQKAVKRQPHKKKAHKVSEIKDKSFESWNVSSPKFTATSTATMPWPSRRCKSAINNSGEPSMKTKLKKIKKEGRVI